MQGHDPRFDGWFVVAVASTGIYCRPSCPARTPERHHVCFFPTAAAAHEAGYRACRRCLPDASPGSPQWRGRSDVAARAMQLVLDGLVDREGVSGLARHLGYSERQLQRVLAAELGAGAAALARAQRAQTARLLLDRSDLPIAAVAFAAGFSSVRQFNDTVRLVFACTPSELRAAARGRGTRQPDGGAITLRLAYRQPFAGTELLGFFASRCVPEVEQVDGDCYRRALGLPHGSGTVALRPGPGYVEASFRLRDLRDLTAAVARCRHLWNLDADPCAVDDALAADPALRPLVASTPGVRVPGAVDGFEIALRAVVGQQVSLGQARQLLARLVTACAGRVDDEVLDPAEPSVCRTFPGAAELAEVLARQPASFAGPASRRRCLLELASAVAEGRVAVDPGQSPDELRRSLTGLHGVGPWTAEYVAMRALGDPDAFLLSDLGLRRGAALVGLPSPPAALAERAERWRPWRAHAQLHLWGVAAAAAAGAAAGAAPPACAARSVARLSA